MRDLDAIERAAALSKEVFMESEITGLPPGYIAGYEATIENGLLLISAGIANIIGKQVYVSGQTDESGVGWLASRQVSTNYYLYLNQDGSFYIDSIAPLMSNLDYAEYHPSQGYRWLANLHVTSDNTLEVITNHINMYAENIYIGYQAGFSTTTGNFNIGIGVDSLYNLTTADNNIGMGYQTLYNSTIGDHNISIGYQGLYNTDVGAHNISMGYQSLYTNIDGAYNIGIGHQALRTNTGSNNIGFGHNSLYDLGLGHRNIGIGSLSLRNVETGLDNTAIGDSSLYRSTGNYNSGFGTKSGYSTIGDSSVFLGHEAGFWETGSDKLFIDNVQRTNEADGRLKALVYGVFDADPANQRLIFNAYVGINDATPDFNLSIGGNAEIVDTTLEFTADYEALNIQQTKTTGASTRNHNFYPILNRATLDYTGGTIGNFFSIYNYAYVIDGNVGDGVAAKHFVGIQNTTRMDDGKVWGNVYGFNNVVDLNSGAGEIVGDVYGARFNIDNDIGVGVTGTVYNVYINNNTGVDYALYVVSGATYFGGHLDVNAAISSGHLTTSAVGPTNNLDVSAVNTVLADCSGGNVTIGGFVGGVVGQILHIVRGCASANSITLEHNEGTGNQDIFLHAGADEVLTSEYGGWILVCDGSNWLDASHAKHV